MLVGPRAVKTLTAHMQRFCGGQIPLSIKKGAVCSSMTANGIDRAPSLNILKHGLHVLTPCQCHIGRDKRSVRVYTSPSNACEPKRLMDVRHSQKGLDTLNPKP